MVLLRNGCDKRQLGDYEIGFKATEEDARNAYQSANIIVSKAKEYLDNK